MTSPSTFTTTVLRESGFEEARLGLSLSYGQTWDSEVDQLHGYEVMLKLACKDGGHNKYLESICVWLDINAPRYFWSEFDTYRIGVTKQSESTMHTIRKTPLTNRNFNVIIKGEYLEYLNGLIETKDPIRKIKAALPEGFMQRRIVCTNYKALRGIYGQRERHRLEEWREFCKALEDQLSHPQLLVRRAEGKG